jgi:hypothetical protein
MDFSQTIGCAWFFSNWENKNGFFHNGEEESSDSIQKAWNPSQLEKYRNGSETFIDL